MRRGRLNDFGEIILQLPCLFGRMLVQPYDALVYDKRV